MRPWCHIVQGKPDGRWYVIKRGAYNLDTLVMNIEGYMFRWDAEQAAREYNLMRDREERARVRARQRST